MSTNAFIAPLSFEIYCKESIYYIANNKQAGIEE